MESTRSGFTLIELLIVVAIIAILAAIAVPNFLEAQTRAKVSRTVSDMRSMAIASETYRVDYSSYAQSADDVFRCGKNPVMGFATYTTDESLRALTTPVAYITSVPKDIFNQIARPEALRPGNGSYFYTTRSCDNSIPWNGVPMPGYGITSIGPDTVFDYSLDPGLPFAAARYYDPTNGTISSGDITKIGPG
jgi:prepilin-type N-terminal cleavage/methylation domain-containing protein